ncbi:MAG: hypothetical protein G01um101419_745 [Parcubacteria group bacterium Gr01-1014_19]|nr:MAG: hypothetical protein G01um101419_745 [Parcubacteria group bacterium Gr01-1014_19]
MIYRRIFCLMIMLVLSGCHSLPPPAEGLKTKYGYSIHGEFTQTQIDSIDTALSYMEPQVIQAVKKIALNFDTDHYERPGAAGHCWPDGVICLNEAALRVIYHAVWHEAAHAYHFSLGEPGIFGSRFYSLILSWLFTAGTVYNVPTAGQQFPANGLLTGYSTNNVFEDIAEFTEAACSYKFGYPDATLRKMKDSGKLHEDPRYAKKLRLLAEYGFISQELCDEILE